MKLFGRTVTSPVTLLPLDAFQRHLLSGVSGLLIWFIASAWPVFGPLRNVDSVWQWFLPMSLLNGLAFHLSSSSLNLNVLPQAVYLIVPIVGVALLVASGIMLLGAFKIMTYPSRLQRFAPIVLGIVIGTIVAIQIVVPLFTHVNDVVFPEDYYKPFIEFDAIKWFLKIAEVIVVLIAPIAVLLISLVPVFAPEKKGK